MEKEHAKVTRLYPVHSRSLSENEGASSPSPSHYLIQGRSGSDVATFSLVQLNTDKNEGNEDKEKMARNDKGSRFPSRLMLRSSSSRVLDEDECENGAAGNTQLPDNSNEDCTVRRSRSGSGSMVFSAIKVRKDSKFSNARGYPIKLPSTERIQSVLETLHSWNRGEERKQEQTLRNRAVSFSNQSLLYSAVSRDDVEELSNLIDSGNVDLNTPDEVGITLLHRAAIDGSYRCLNFLLSCGADVDVTDLEGWTPLHDSVFHGHLRCAVILLISGANVEAETKDFLKPIEMAEDEEMILVVGRAMALNQNGQNSNYDKETLV